jgi:hypothetical protein
MPIERLLPSGLPALPTLKTSHAAAKPRFRTLKRIGGHVLLATLTVLAVALWKLPLRQLVRARSLPPSAATTVADVQPQSAAAEPDIAGRSKRASLEPVDAAAANSAAPNKKSATAETAARAGQADLSANTVTKPKATSLQRQAVELVIAGDFPAAEQAYRMLASEHPDTHSFHEAARILAARRGP